MAALGVTSLGFAQPAPKVYVLDLAKVFEGHYKTEEQRAKLNSDQKKAVEELERFEKEIRTMADKFKEQKEQMDNPALTNDARERAKTDAQSTMEGIQQKQQDGQRFRMDAERSFQQRIGNFRAVLIEEISKLATDVMKRKGGTILMDKGTLIFSDPAYDITDEVIAEVNKSRPAGSTTGATPAAPAAKDATPAVTFPGAKK